MQIGFAAWELFSALRKNEKVLDTTLLEEFGTDAADTEKAAYKEACDLEVSRLMLVRMEPDLQTPLRLVCLKEWRHILSLIDWSRNFQSIRVISFIICLFFKLLISV